MKWLSAAVTLLFSLPVLAGPIDFGQASDYNVFVKQNFKANSSDTQGRVAAGGDVIVEGGYDIGFKIDAFGMGSGPSLVVGGNVRKSGGGHLNVYEDGVHQSPHSGKLAYAGTVSGSNIEATLVKVDKSQLPVDFDSAFAHLKQLSAELASRTASASTEHKWSRLDFNPTSTPPDNVYVFNVTQEQINASTDWFVNGVAENATIIFNISNPNGIAGKDWNGCPAGDSGCVQLSQHKVYINGKATSDYFQEHNLDGRLPSQVLYNFAGASKVNIATDVFGSILAPDAAIKTGWSPVWGQVIGKSWEGNGQINYDPFEPVGSTPPPNPISEPSLAMLFALLAGLLLWRRSTPVSCQPALA
ncbi:choice-of-anchor A family protein [Bowmanella denitrificans]|uniref:choice-of-anchor A family protein n=1 Tax=Bowmanella denitrificans TaxID=366582 RepID=UPI000C9AB60F|nr:choice-of-anchor A family protein [Bowmanella denitrificans]